MKNRNTKRIPSGMQRSTKNEIKYEFSAKTWLNTWLFVSLPKAMASEIRENLQWQEEGWGRMKARAKIGESEWETAIWFDTKHDTYILPLKAEIKKKEKIGVEQDVNVAIWI